MGIFGGNPRFAHHTCSIKNMAIHVLVLHFSASGKLTCVRLNSYINLPLWRPNCIANDFASVINRYEQSSKTFSLGRGQLPRINKAWTMCVERGVCIQHVSIASCLIREHKLLYSVGVGSDSEAVKQTVQNNNCDCWYNSAAELDWIMGRNGKYCVMNRWWSSSACSYERRTSPTI